MRITRRRILAVLIACLVIISSVLPINAFETGRAESGWEDADAGSTSDGSQEWADPDYTDSQKGDSYSSTGEESQCYENAGEEGTFYGSTEEEADNEAAEDEEVPGKLALYLSEAEVTALIVISSDKGADGSDPSITFEKKPGEGGKVWYRNESVEEAAFVDQDGSIFLSLAPGTRVWLSAEPVKGFKISRYSEAMNGGDFTDLLFDGLNTGSYIEWEYEVAEGAADAFELKTEEVQEDQDDAPEEGQDGNDEGEEAEPPSGETADEGFENPGAEDAQDGPEDPGVEDPWENGQEEDRNEDPETEVTQKNGQEKAHETEETNKKEDAEGQEEDPDSKPSTETQQESGDEGSAGGKAREEAGEDASVEGSGPDRQKTGQESQDTQEESGAENQNEDAALDSQASTPTDISSNLLIKIGSEGGTVNVADSGKTVLTLEKAGNSIYITGTEGRRHKAELSKDGAAAAAHGEPGKEYTVTAAAEEGFGIASFTITGSGAFSAPEGAESARGKDAFSCGVSLAEGDVTVCVSFMPMPAFYAEQKVGSVTVKVSAGEGRLPEGTSVEIREMPKAEAAEYVEKAKELSADPESAEPVLAVDITFRDADREEIHPSGPVEVAFEDVADQAAAMDVYHAVDSDASKMETLETGVYGNDVVFQSKNFSPVILMASGAKAGLSMPNPAGDSGTFNGASGTPTSVTIGDDSYGEIEYEDYGYKVDGDHILDHTRPLDVTDNEGNEGTLICIDPNGGGFNSGDVKTHIEKITSANLIKALYYGTPGFGHNYAKDIAGSAEGGIILAHYAASFYARANALAQGHSFFENTGSGRDAQKTWAAMNTQLQNDIISYMNTLAGLNTPTGVTGYVVYYQDGYSLIGYQYYAYLQEDSSGEARIRKRSSAPASTEGNSNYYYTWGKFAIYDTRAHAQACINSGGTDERQAYATGRLKVLTTDSDGNTPTYSLDAGTYYVVETKAPKGYKLLNTIKTLRVTASSTETLTFRDPPIKPPIKIIKTSSDTSSTNGNSNYSYEGAVFFVYDTQAHAQALGTEGRVKVLKTDATGNTPEYNIIAGTYYIREAKAPPGYKRLETIKTITVRTDQEGTKTVTFSDPPIKPPIKIRKTSSDTSVTNGNSNYSYEGAKFFVYDTLAHAQTLEREGRIANLTTDATGYTPEYEIAAGTYYVVEALAPPGYKRLTEIKTITVRTDQVGTQTVTFSDPPIKPKIRVRKLSSNTSVTNGNSNYSYEGAKFFVYDTLAHAQTLEREGRIANLTTDATGYTPEYEIAAGTYYVVEALAPPGYKRLTEIKTLTVAIDQVGTQTVTFSDPPKTGKVKATKTSANTAATNGNSNYSLQGAEFSIYDTQANANLGGATGRKAVLTTNASGVTPEYELPLGTYYMAETKAPPGYAIPATHVWSFTITEDSTSTINVTVADPPKTGKVKATKTSASALVSSGNANYSLQGAEFSIYDTQTNANLGGTTGRKAVLTTNASGVTPEYELPLGTYYMAETKAPPGYKIPATHVWSFTITADNTSNVSVSDPPETTFLKLKKTVQGNLGDRYKNFTFEVTAAGMAGATVKDDGGTSYTFNSSGKLTLTLRHGQEIKLNGFLYGMKATVKEVPDADTPAYKVTYTINSGSRQSGMTTSEMTFTSNGLDVVFTNTLDTLIRTGVSMNPLSGIMLAAVGIAGLMFITTFTKLRRKERN